MGKSGQLPVLIVGGGPVGLVLAILLNKLGVKCSVLEKSNSYSRHPQAHFINYRSMEVLRKIEGMVEEIERLQAPKDLWRKYVHCTTLAGTILGSVDHIRPEDFEKRVSPEFVGHFSHYKFIALLFKHLEKHDFQVYGPNGLDCTSHEEPLRGGEILMGHEFVSFNSTDQGVTATVSFLKEGKSTERKIECSILVGADGAGSIVQKLLEIGMKGEKDLQRLMTIHFFSKDLGRYILDKEPAMLFLIFNSQSVANLVCHDLKEGEFILHTPFFPPQQHITDYTYEVCKKIICDIAGREFLDVDVKNIKPWVMNAQVAEKYLSDDNRIILVGDAAHRFPPSGGFGMNTGIQDAHNLAWKIASVINGVTPWSILRTYETERQPIASFNAKLSVLNFGAVNEVASALGVDLYVAKTVHRIFNYTLGYILPIAAQKKILNAIIKIGLAQLSEHILNENNPIGRSRLAKIRNIFEDGRSLRLLFPAEDLGFRYLEGALVTDSVNMENAPMELSRYRREYVPCADPGSRLPHMNVRIFSKLHEEPRSTLDLVSGDKVEFLLIIAPEEGSYLLARSALEVFGEFKVDLKVCVLWPANSMTTYESKTKMALKPWKNFVDVVEIKKSDDSLSWWRTCQMTELGAILVRPDEHIAWRVKSGIVEDRILELKRVCSTILGIKKD
jgi:2-polyprenyl-6-methoxyphenol hydroxylase-like FAD-dependent oxidoreductase